MNVFSRVRRWFADTDLVVLLAVSCVVCGIWLFLTLADAVTEGSTQELDGRILLALRDPHDLSKPIGPKFLVEVGRDLTALGGVTVLFLTTLTVAGYLCMRRMYHAVVFLVGATSSGLALSTFLKALIGRPRPELAPHLAGAFTSSFPSGHSMLSAVVYLTLGTLLARCVAERRLKMYFLGVALLLTGLVGASRVYMGVHYPSDVLAGWSAGLAWAILCWLLARSLQLRGAVEQIHDDRV